MRWYLTDQADPRAIELADKHYSRKHKGSAGVMPPGRMVVLLTEDGNAVWGTSWPYAAMLRRTWATESWMCTIFRNESPFLSSELILEAIAATRWIWGEPPRDGMVTLIDAKKIKSTNPGYCYKMAGFQRIGFAKKGHTILQMLPEAMPEPCMPRGVKAKSIELERSVIRPTLIA
jgi:hypothetical protein